MRSTLSFVGLVVFYGTIAAFAANQAYPGAVDEYINRANQYLADNNIPIALYGAEVQQQILLWAALGAPLVLFLLSSSLSSSLRTARKLLKKTRTELAEQSERLHNEQLSADRLRADFRDLDQEVTEEKRELQRARQKIEELRAKLDEKKARIKELKDKVEQLEEHLEELGNARLMEERIKTSTAATEEAKDKLSQVTEDNNNLWQQLNELQVKLTAAEHEAQTYQQHAKENHEQHKAALDKLVKLQEEHRKLEVENATNKAKLDGKGMDAETAKRLSTAEVNAAAHKAQLDLIDPKTYKDLVADKAKYEAEAKLLREQAKANEQAHTKLQQLLEATTKRLDSLDEAKKKLDGSASFIETVNGRLGTITETITNVNNVAAAVGASIEELRQGQQELTESTAISNRLTEVSERLSTIQGAILHQPATVAPIGNGHPVSVTQES